MSAAMTAFPESTAHSPPSATLWQPVQRVEDKLNSRPRKILGYRTPREVFVNANNLPVALHC
jgi:IS30 family transposase